MPICPPLSYMTRSPRWACSASVVSRLWAANQRMYPAARRRAPPIRPNSPALAKARKTRPEQSMVYGPSVPTLYGVPRYARAAAMTASTRSSWAGWAALLSRALVGTAGVGWVADPGWLWVGGSSAYTAPVGRTHARATHIAANVIRPRRERRIWVRRTVRTGDIRPPPGCN